MFFGLLAGILWALDTVILGSAMARSPFTTALLTAPLVATFIHDLCSALWMLGYSGFKRQLAAVRRAATTRSGRFIILGALIGGPIGMSGYVAAIAFMGPAYTAIISSLFPAAGAVLAYIFLGERMSVTQMLGLAVAITGVIVLGSTSGQGGNGQLLPGILCALLCCIAWGAEAVICAYGLKDPSITDEHALQLRQITSALTYGLLILPVLRAWPLTLDAIATPATGLIALAALVGTASYVFYYRAIVRTGATTAMALNITYAAWSILFAFVIFRTLPDLRAIICALFIVAGALVAAGALKAKPAPPTAPLTPH